jgi:hypothetical protein
MDSRGSQDGADFNVRILAAIKSFEERVAFLVAVGRAPARVESSTAVSSVLAIRINSSSAQAG